MECRQAELVAKQSDISSKLKFACTVVFGENCNHAVLSICDYNISWRHPPDIKIGKLEHGLVDLLTGT